MTSGTAEKPRAGARSVLILFGFRLVAGVVVGYPAARALAASAGSYPHGDRSLFEPGGFYLVETLRLGARALPAAFEGAAFVAVVLALLGVLPLAAALESILAPAAPRAEISRRALERLPAFSVIGGVSVLAEAAAAVAAAAVLSALRDPLQAITDERTGDVALAVLAALFAAGIFGIGVVEDLARARIVRNGSGPARAAFGALGALKRSPLRVGGNALVPVAGGLGLVAIAGSVVGSVDVSRPGAARVLAVFLIHQSAVLGAAYLRARWLAESLALAGPASRGASGGGDGLAIDLDIAPSRPIPGEIEPHGAAPE